MRSAVGAHRHAGLRQRLPQLSGSGQGRPESRDRSSVNFREPAGVTRVESELNDFPFVMIDPATVLDEKDMWDADLE
ncbi:MAG: hypothetical protein O2930_14920 [Acidobacteria bacterium]|nr:hypothetical protein [Acidobacteriota bacterium]